MVHQPSAGFQFATDIQIAKEIFAAKDRLNKIYSKHTGKSVDEISNALELIILRAEKKQKIRSYRLCCGKRK